MIFARKSLFSFLLISSLLTLVVYWNVRIKSTDLALFDEIQRLSRALTKSQNPQQRITKQKRENSQKDFWISKGEKKEHLTISADSSELTFKHDDFKFDAEEFLTNIHGSFVSDQKDTGPFFEAKSAKADYSSHQLFIDEIILTMQDGILQAGHARFGQEDLDTPYVFSNGVTFRLKKSDDLFLISSNQAIVSMKNGKKDKKGQKIDFFQNVHITAGDKLKACAENAKFTENEIVLTPKSLDENCYVCLSEEILIDIFSKSAKVILKNKKPQQVVIEEEIHMVSPSIQNKPSHALADFLTYDLLEKKIHLKAKENKRVLFWQEDLKLSAPEIIISKDPATQKDIVEAKGDLKVSFDRKETSRIEDFFKRYL